MDRIKPNKLRPGATIGVCAPSNAAPHDYLSVIQANIEQMGFKVFVHPQCLLRDRQSAGTSGEKLAALHELFYNPNIDAIFTVRGGNRALQMLDGLDISLIRNNPKILLGYSDITSLQMTLLRKAGLVSFHGPIARNFMSLSDNEMQATQFSCRAAMNVLQGDVFDDFFTYAKKSVVLKTGMATGPLIGGNISLLNALFVAGENYYPDLTGAILMIEDIAEEWSHIDRVLLSWKLKGIFKKVAAVVVGHMTDMKDTAVGGMLFERDLPTILSEHLADFAGPVVLGAPFGHDDPNIVFAQGIPATLNAGRAGISMKLNESPFAD